MCCRVLKGRRFDPYQLTTPDEAQQEKTVVGRGSTNRMRVRRRKEGLDRGAGHRHKRPFSYKSRQLGPALFKR